MALGLLATPTVQITKAAIAVFGVAPGNFYLSQYLEYDKANGTAATIEAIAKLAGGSDAAFVTTFLTNIGLASSTIAQAYMTSQVAASGRGAAITGAFTALDAYDGTAAGADPTIAAAATTFSTKVVTGVQYSTNVANNSTDVTVLAAAVSAEAITNVSNLNLALTTAVDTSLTGGSGNDAIVGTLNYSGGTLANTSTYSDSDMVKGGGGTDTFSLSVSGGDVGADTYTPTLTSIETLALKIYENDANQSTTIDLALADASLTTVGTVSSTSSNASVSLSNVGEGVGLTMAGKGDLTVGHTSGSYPGSADAATVTMSTVGTSFLTTTGVRADLSVDLVETLNLDVTGKNFVTIADNSFTALNITGSGDLSADVTDGQIVTVDASAATGKVYLDLTATTVSTLLSVKGGSGTTDIVRTDEVVTVTGSTAAKNTHSVITGFETLQQWGAFGVVLSTNDLGISDFDLEEGGTTQGNLTLNTGYTGATTVALGRTDDVSNAANVALTMAVSSDDLLAGSTLTGGTGVDVINVKANGGTSVVSNVTLVETVNVVVGTLGTEDVVMNVGAANGTVASKKTLTVDASTLPSGATLSFTGTGETDGYFSLVGGAGADTLIGGSKEDTITDAAGANVLTGAAGNDTITGGTGKDTIDAGAGNDVVVGGGADDSITAGAGNDSIDAGAGNDAIVLGANLTAADTIDGGEGTDTLKVTSITTAALANVSNVENLGITGASSVSLTSNLAFDQIDASDDTGAQAITFGTGYTKATTVKLGSTSTNNDSIINTANIALTVDIKDAGMLDSAVTLTGGTLVGSTGADTILLTADASDTADFTNVTLFDAVTVRDGTVSGDDLTISLGAYATAISIDASALNGTTETLTVDGNTATKNITVIGGAGADTITGGAGNDAITGAGSADRFNEMDGNDSIDGGAGNDLFNVGNGHLTYQDTLKGGDGTDTMELDTTTAVADVAFQYVSGIENVLMTDDGTPGVSIGAYASAGGVTKVTGVATDTNLINAAAATTNLTMVAATTTAKHDTLTGGSGDDTFVFSGTAGLQDGDVLVGTSGNDTVQLDNTAGAVTAEVDLDDVTKMDNIKVKDDDGGTAGTANAISLTLSAISLTTAQTINIDASAITDTADILTMANNAGGSVHKTAFNITGGSGADVLIGAWMNDTIVGGGGADDITGSVGVNTLTGSGGADNFIFGATTAGVPDSGGSKVSTVTDFAAGSDNVRAVVTGSATNLTYDFTDKGDVTSDSDALSLMGSKIGQYAFNTTTKAFLMDTTGNGLLQATDLKVILTGAAGLNSADVDIYLTTAAGTNVVDTADGNDSITGGGGIDTVITGKGNDTIKAANGANQITAGAGNDSVYHNANAASNNVLGAGNDTLEFTGDITSNDSVDMGTGTDTLVFNYAGGVTFNNLLAGDKDIASNANVEQIVLTAGQTATFVQANTMDGDAIAFNSVAAGIATIAIGTLTDTNYTMANFTFSAFNYHNGQSTGIALGSDDIITVTMPGGAATMVGSAIGDSITGGSGVNTITGGEGVDTIRGAAGADTYNLAETTAAADIVHLEGSAGANTIATDINNIINDFAAGSDTIDLQTNGAAKAGVANTGFSTAAIVGNIADLKGMHTIGANITVAGAVPTEAEMATYFGSAEVFFSNHANSGIYVAVDDGTDTYILDLQSNATNKVFTNADEGVTIAKLVGLADATTLVAGSFLDFT